jgi:hypothetical protein
MKAYANTGAMTMRESVSAMAGLNVFIVSLVP